MTRHSAGMGTLVQGLWLQANPLPIFHSFFPLIHAWRNAPRTAYSCMGCYRQLTTDGSLRWDRQLQEWTYLVIGHSFPAGRRTERGIEQQALIMIAMWYRERSPPMTLQYYMNQGRPEGDVMTGLLASSWYRHIKDYLFGGSHHTTSMLQAEWQPIDANQSDWSFMC